MSSTVFSTELRPDRRLRLLLLIFAAIAAIAGLLLIVHLPMSVISRTALALSWLLWCCIEIFLLRRAWAQVSRIGINQLGEVWVIDIDGARWPASLQRGSVVISRFAWLKIRLEDGRKYAELVSGNAVEDCQWHRFQLIWKQSGQIVGGVDRS